MKSLANAADGQKQSLITVPQPLADSINTMQKLLNEYFGCDYSFTIMAHGITVAASNMKDGEIIPKVLP